MNLPLTFRTIVATCLVACAAPALAGELNVYSYRQPFLLKPLTDAFTKQTGHIVNVVYAKKGMLERIKAEGANSPADAVLTSDIGRLNDMAQANVLANTQSAKLNETVAPNLRHPDGLWYGLTTRARVIFVSRERITSDTPMTYESLADPKYRGKICFRSGKHVYNVSLIASMIAHHGATDTEKWLRGVKANLARKPKGNDRAQAKAIHSGECDIAIGNTYYYGKMATNKKKRKQQDWARSIRVVFPNQSDRGTHVNISGAAVLDSSKNKELAVQFIEFLVSEQAQQIYAHQNFEYPVLSSVKPDEVTASLGEFKADAVNLEDVAKHRVTASKLVDTVGFDQGAAD